MMAPTDTLAVLRARVDAAHIELQAAIRALNREENRLCDEMRAARNEFLNRPRGLDAQIAAAQAEVAAWPPGKLGMMRLQGGDDPHSATLPL